MRDVARLNPATTPQPSASFKDTASQVTAELPALISDFPPSPIHPRTDAQQSD